MEAFVMSVETLPIPIREKIHAPKVSVQEREGNIILIPLKEMTSQEQKSKTSRGFIGCMKGQIWMSDDFDEPLEDFKEYME